MPSNIVIRTEPPAYAPVYNRVQFCADETGFTPDSKTNYKYIFTLYYETDVGSISGSQKFYIPYFVEDDNNQYGILDVSRYLDAWVKEVLPSNDIGGFANGFYRGERNFIVEYYVEILSGWDVAGVFTEDPDAVGPVTSSTLYAWNGSFEHSDWIYQMNQATPFNTWICNITNGSSAKFLTNQPQTSRYSELEQTGYTWYMTDTITDIDQMKIVTYDGLDATGSVVASFLVNNTAALAAQVPNRLGRIASAPGTLNVIPGGQFGSGAQPVIPSTGVKSYTIVLQNSSNTDASETLTYNIVDPCTIFFNLR